MLWVYRQSSSFKDGVLDLQIRLVYLPRIVSFWMSQSVSRFLFHTAYVSFHIFQEQTESFFCHASNLRLPSGGIPKNHPIHNPFQVQGTDFHA